MRELMRRRPWRRKDVIMLLEGLEMYASSGLTIDQALRVSSEGMSMRRRNDLLQACVAVEAGGSLFKAIASSVGLSETVAGLIEHGEASGSLVQSFRMGKALMERQDELKKRCVSAMAYPAVIGLFAGALTIGLMRGVMPQIIPMLESLHMELPLLTRVVIGVSEVLMAYGLYLAIAIIISGVSVSMIYRRHRGFRSLCQAGILKTPLVGGLVHDYALSVFMRSCGSLIESGLPVPTAFVRTARTVTIIPLQKSLQSHAGSISRGATLSSAITGRNIPSYVVPLIRAGETSGTLGGSIIRAASIIDRDIEHSLKRLTSLIEPVMMAGMGIIVGSIALSIMMPIYDISRVLQR